MNLAAIALMALVTGANCREAAGPRQGGGAAHVPRDIVLVTIDTLRYDAVGFDGNPRGTTPNLDRIAAAGRVFTAAHAHNVITLPSHTNILTGLYPYEHGVRENAGFRLSPKIESIAPVLKARGYATAAIVGAFPLDSRYGLTPGFDLYEEMYRQSEQPEDFQIQQARADEVVRRALGWYAGAAGRPRFLWVHVYDPHAPYDPPEEWRTRFPDDLYLGEVAYTDAALRPLLDAITKTTPSPLLIVTGDHGEARGDHGELTHGLFTYEATLHVPLLLWCPDLLTPARDAKSARHVDIVPSILDAIGGRSTRTLPGKSLLGTPREEAPEGSYFESLSATFNRGWAPLRGLLARGEKYVDLPVPELYDLPADPLEVKNLVSDRSDSVRRLRKRLLELPAGSAERGAIGSDEAAKLRSLGYLTGSAQEKKRYGPADDPKNLIEVDGQLHRIVELFQLGRSAEAIPIGRRVIAANPEMKAGYFQLGYLLQSVGNQAGALLVYDQALAHGLKGESLDRKRALLLSEMGRPADAVKALEPYRESEDLETLNALGIALSDAGRPEDALPLFSRALQIQPRNAAAFQNTGIALLKLNRLDESRQNLESALAISRRSPRSLNALGVVWARLGDPRKAVEAWARCVEVDPQQYDALYNLGRVAGQIGDWKRSREALTRFVATAPPGRYAKDIREVRAVLASLPTG